MSDPKKKKQTDSTTDFFLQFMKEEKSDKEKTEAKKEEREQTYTKTVEKFSSGYNYFNKLLDKLLANKHSVRILWWRCHEFYHCRGNFKESASTGRRFKGRL